MNATFFGQTLWKWAAFIAVVLGTMMIVGIVGKKLVE